VFPFKKPRYIPDEIMPGPSRKRQRTVDNEDDTDTGKKFELSRNQ
jgi:hypothetical protein